MKKLALAFDFENRDHFLKSLEIFHGLKIVCKVGLRLLPLLSQKDFETIKKKFELFIDAKVHDIPTQVEGAVRTWKNLGADYLTVHLSGGPAMLEAAQAAAGFETKILGVSVLTSLGTDDLKIMGMSSCDEMVTRLISLGVQKSLSGFVLSSQELRKLKTNFPNSSIIWTVPGLVLNSGHLVSGDQTRVGTLEEALKDGAMMPVIGRAVFQTENPRKTTENILEKIYASSF